MYIEHVVCMAVWIHMYMYYTNIGMLDITACLSHHVGHNSGLW